MTIHRFRIARDYGTDLSSRSRAASLRIAIVEASSRHGDTCEIDFADVRTVSDSFADEVFAILVLQQGEDWFREHLALVNLAPQIRTTILETIADRLCLSEPT